MFPLDISKMLYGLVAILVAYTIYKIVSYFVSERKRKDKKEDKEEKKEEKTDTEKHFQDRQTAWFKKYTGKFDYSTKCHLKHNFKRDQIGKRGMCKNGDTMVTYVRDIQGYWCPMGSRKALCKKGINKD